MRAKVLIAVDVGLMLVLAATVTQFRNPANIAVLIDSIALDAMGLVVMTMLLIAGLFDLSLDGVVAFSGVVAGELMIAGVDPIFAIIAGLATGALFGLVNGVCVAHWNLNPLMVTLATGWIAIGATLGVTKALSPFGFPDWFQRIGQAQILGLRAFVFYAIVICLLGSLMLHFTVTGRHIYAMGGNKRASILTGIRVKSLGVRLYVQTGLVAGFIGVVMTSRLNAASPQAVDGMDLRVIAAAVIGGCSLSGGRGSIWAGLLGLVLMAILSNASILLSVSPYWQKGLIGAILLIAIASERIGAKTVNGS